MSHVLRRTVVVYNTDFESGTTISPIEATSIREAAAAVRDGLVAAGLDSKLVGVHGHDLADRVRELRADPPDVVFNLCESLAGDSKNEPAMPAMLDLHALLYTGSSALGLGLSLYKHKTKDVLRGRGVATPPHLYLASPEGLEAAPLAQLDYPWFLKLASEDASVGITADNVARDADGLRARARALFAEFKSPLIAERYIEGREVNVTLLGNGADLQVLPLHEIDFSKMPADRPRIVSYAAKWDEKHVDYEGTKPVPMREVGSDVIAAIEHTARAAWHAVGLRDYGRIDLRIDAAGRPWVIDVNPNCDISPDAGAARAARAGGLDYPTFVRRIAEAAWRRGRSPV